MDDNPQFGRFKDLKRKLKAQGWHLEGNAPPRKNDVKVIGMKAAGTPAQALTKGFLRHDWLSGSPPIDVPPGKPATYYDTVEFSEKEKVYTFILPGGKKLTRGSLLDKPPKFTGVKTPTSNEFHLMAISRPRKIFFLYQTVELLENGKVTRRWYKTSPLIVIFSRKPEPKK